MKRKRINPDIVDFRIMQKAQRFPQRLRIGIWPKPGIDVRGKPMHTIRPMQCPNCKRSVDTSPLTRPPIQQCRCGVVFITELETVRAGGSKNWQAAMVREYGEHFKYVVIP